jgi:hypothetical protein
MPIKTETNKKEETSGDHGRVLASWEFAEFIKQDRGLAWYIGAGLVGAMLIIYSLVTANYLFALIVIITVFIILINSLKEPIKMNFSITEDGLLLEKRFYSFRDIKRFWIIYEPPRVKTIYFDFNSALRPKLSIPLMDQNPLSIRQIALEYLEEDLKEENESGTDALEKLLKL